MRTTLDLPADLIDEARAAIGFKSKTDTVVFALREVVRRNHMEDLKKRFYDRSRQWHPDRFSRASAAEQDHALEMTAVLNDAFRTLREPVARAEYFLKARGVELSNTPPPELLEEVFELNMALEELRSGEDSGTLDETLLKVHKQLQFDREVARQIKSAMRYPTFVLIAISIAIAVLSVKVIPVFAKLFASMKVQLPLMTRVLIGFSDFVMNYWWGIIGFAVVIVALARSLYSTPDGRYQWDRWKNKIPIVGGILYKATMARLAYTFASASRSGVPLLNTLKLSAAVTENQFFIERINLMCNMVQRGESLYASALGSGLFMAVELQMISAGEATGRVDEMMEHVASMYEEDTRAAISALSQSIEPILIVMMSLIVGVLVLGIFVPMWDMGQAARAR